MSNGVTFTVKGEEGFAFLAKNFEQVSKGELAAALDKTLQDGQSIVRRTIQQANAVGHGVVLNSVITRINEASMDRWQMFGEITFNSPADKYVDYADDGRESGGMPPLDKIRAWTRIKGIPENLAYPIARSIGARGTNVAGWSKYGRTSFLRTSALRIDAVAAKEFNKLASRIQRRIDSNAANYSRST
jgi:hypothetical protein